MLFKRRGHFRYPCGRVRLLARPHAMWQVYGTARGMSLGAFKRSCVRLEDHNDRVASGPKMHNITKTVVNANGSVGGCLLVDLVQPQRSAGCLDLVSSVEAMVYSRT